MRSGHRVAAARFSDATTADGGAVTSSPRPGAAGRQAKQAATPAGYHSASGWLVAVDSWTRSRAGREAEKKLEGETIYSGRLAEASGTALAVAGAVPARVPSAGVIRC